VNKIRRTRITFRKRELIIVGSQPGEDNFENETIEVCPMCHYPIRPSQLLPANDGSAAISATGNKKAAELPAADGTGDGEN
jgi:hypothetical protein